MGPFMVELGAEAFEAALQSHAFLRGASPMNAKMSDLKRCFESAGFVDVKTILSSGNVAFTTHDLAEAELQKRAEHAMNTDIGKTFITIVRRADTLRRIIDSDPFTAYQGPAKAKRAVTFLREDPDTRVTLPFESEGVRILSLRNKELFTDYIPNARGPVFMTLIEKMFGTDLTTRTRDTVKKCAIA